MSTILASDLQDLLPVMLPRLRAFALRLCGDRHDAEDLLQRSCLRGLERTHQLRPDTAPLSWMFSIVQSLWIDELRAHKVRGRSHVAWDDAVLTVADTSARAPDAMLLSREVMEAIGRLPDVQQTVILLVLGEGLSYAEAAEALDVPVGTVMSRLSRARRTIGEWVNG